MERHIGLWDNEEKSDPQVAELIIDGNHIEFYRRGMNEVFPCAFIGNNGEHSYKVFSAGCGINGKNRTLELATSYKVPYVLLQNYEYETGMEIKGIKECSFIIPELIEWIGQKTVEWGVTEEEEVIAAETKRPEIVLKNENPRIEIYLEGSSILDSMKLDERTTFIIKNQPRVRIKYDVEVDIPILQSDIRSIMQFCGLMIGKVTDALDIRLSREGVTHKSWLYINEDFSYNLRTLPSIDRPRTNLSQIGEKVNTYFEGWYAFYQDDTFELVRRMYFMGNDRRDIFAEDILVQYVKILEGYYLRINGDEEKSDDLKNVLGKVEREIKTLIFNEDGKALFTKALEAVDPSWKFNSRHSLDVAKWIAAGYLGKKPLAEKIKELDTDYYEIVAKNARYVIGLSVPEKEKEEFEKKDEKEVAHTFYQSIVKTRNYFSHYKVDKTDVLNFTQMCRAINILKALIIMIFYRHMGMDKESIRKIVIWDSELHFETMILRKDGERPDDDLQQVGD